MAMAKPRGLIRNPPIAAAVVVVVVEVAVAVVPLVFRDHECTD